MGKYFGLSLTLLVNVSIMTAGLYLILFVMDEPLDPALLKAIYFIYLKLAVLVGVAMLFSTFTSSTLAGLFTLFTFVAGSFSTDLKNFESVVESTYLPFVTRALYYVLPNFRSFDVKAPVVAGQPVALDQIAWTTGYALGYVAVLLLASSWIFQRRNLK
jgi:ABC-type transport system involved in multi-copper enzyme maturation permease subunit